MSDAVASKCNLYNHSIMFPETKCEHCPLISNGDTGRCLAQITKHARYCHHAEQGNQGYIDIILGQSREIEVSKVVVREPSFPLGSPPGNASEAERMAAQEELNRIKSCRYLKLCGCGGGRLGDCSLGLGNGGKVKIENCRSCDKWESK